MADGLWISISCNSALWIFQILIKQFVSSLQGIKKVMRKRKLLPEVYAKAEAHFAIFTVDWFLATFCLGARQNEEEELNDGRHEL